MSALTVDQSQGLFEQGTGAVQVEPVNVQASLEDYFGEGVIVTGYETANRRDYVDGVRVGGALVVRCTLLGEHGTTTDDIEIDDSRRPLPEPVITALGAEALGNGVWIRDSFRAA